MFRTFWRNSGKLSKSRRLEAQETISYRMPAYKLNGNRLVYFAAWKRHIALYGASSAVDAFRKELSPYEVSKGTIRFPLDKPIPFELVARIVRFRVKKA